MYSGPTDYKLLPMYNEYVIHCLDGDAFSFQHGYWYAIALEIDGKRVPGTKKELVSMKVSA